MLKSPAMFGALLVELPPKTHSLRRQLCGFFGKILRDESGSTAIEYGLIGALISVVIFASVTMVGTQLSGVFNSIATAFSTAS